jgi:hypothetical protein
MLPDAVDIHLFIVLLVLGGSAYFLKPELFKTFLEKVDYAIVPEYYGSRGIDTFSNNEPEVLTKAGLEFYRIIVDNPNNKVSRGFLDRNSLGGGLPYGAYKAYKRTIK